MYRMHISTIIVCVDSSTVPAIGLFRWQYNASNRVVFVGKSARNLVGRLQAYRYNQYRNSRHSGAISLSIVYGSTVLAQGRFRRQIGTESCHRLIGSQGISVTTVIRFSCRRYWQFFLL